MKAIILAAGKGSRISKKIDGLPKSALPLSDGTPIIKKTATEMLELGITPCLCVGYKMNKLKEILCDLNINYYFNPFFGITNNIASLWFALKEFDGKEDIILTSADLYYPKDFLIKLLDSSANLAMLVDSSRLNNGDFYLSVNNEGIVQEYGPNIPMEKRSFEYMGLTKISKDYVLQVKERIENYIYEERFNSYFEDMILSFNMEKKKSIQFIDICGSFWREFDFYDDYQVILDYEREQNID